MNPISRRDTLRIAGGTIATAGVAGGTLLGPGTLSTSAAPGPKKVRAKLNRTMFSPGQRMVLRISEDLQPGRRIRVVDSTGTKWKRISKTNRRQVWAAHSGRSGVTGRVEVRVLWPDGRKVANKRYRDAVTYRVVQGSGVPLADGALIGMSSPADLWATRVSEVGGGLAARRIFADLASGSSSQLKLVEEAHDDGMLPVISYKVGGDVAGAISGKFNAVAADAAAKLASFGLPTAVTFWHEPYGDMTGAEYAAASRQLVPIFKRDELRVGPILNGWLLDNKVSTFASFAPDDLLDMWDWFGIDTYESGTMESPGDNKPAHRIPAMASFLSSRGHAGMAMGVGEYNGYSAATIAAAGEALLTTPNVWFGCMWNSDGGKGIALSGSRLDAFQDTLADPRSAEPRSV
jgi:hypothetical protein